MDGYACLIKNRCRVNERGRFPGGLAIFYKTQFGDKVTEIHSNLQEIMWVMFEDNDTVFLLGVVYLHPESSVMANIDFFNQLTEEIINLTHRYPRAEIIIGGDWNARTGNTHDEDSTDADRYSCTSGYDLLNTRLGVRENKDKVLNKYGKQFLKFVRDLDFIILNGRTKSDKDGEFTFVSKNGSSSVDYVIATPKIWNEGMDLRVGDESQSHHFPVEVQLSSLNTQEETSCEIVGSKIKKFRWKDCERTNFLGKLNCNETELFLIGIRRMLELNDIDNTVLLMQKWFNFLGSEMENVSNRDYLHPNYKNRWFDVDCKNKKKELKHKLRAMRKNVRPESTIEYLDCRREYINLCKMKKLQEKLSYIQEIQTALEMKDNKRLWLLLKNNENRPTNNKCNNITPNAWIEHYQNLYGDQSGCAEVHVEIIRDELENNNDNDVLDREIDLSEVGNVVISLKSRKAGGRDGLLNEFLKLGFLNNNEALNIFVLFLNKLKDMKIFPKGWNVGIICNLFKGKGSALDPNNYRGLTLMPSISKIYTKILSMRIQEWVELEQKISKYQTGFRVGYEVLDNLLVMKTLIQKTLKMKRSKLYCCFIDFEKAFDSVDRNLLWDKLIRMKMSPGMVEILKSIYKEPGCCVRINENYVSDVFYTTRGLRQGCQLSAILFVLFINDIVEHMEDIETISPCIKRDEIKILLYADDAVLLSNSVGGMRRSLKALENYCLKWKLTVNVNKTKMLTIRNGNKQGKNENWIYNGAQIEVVNNFQYLGLFICYNGKWSLHQNKMLEKASKALMVIRRKIYLYKNFPAKVLLNMFKMMVLPILLYGKEIWGLEKCEKSINIFVHSFYKEILGVAKSSPNSAIRLELGQVSIEADILQHFLSYYCRVHLSNKVLQKNCYGLNDETEKIQNKLLGLDFKNEDVMNNNYVEIRKQVKVKVRDHFLKETLLDVSNKVSLDFYSKLDHYEGGAFYINLTERDMRRMLCMFRMNRFAWENKKNLSGERICVLCNGIESVEHLIEDCYGTAGNERDNVYNRGLNSAKLILDAKDEVDLIAVYEYLCYILDRRSQYL